VARIGEFVLSDEHRMLLDIRDTLYEGNWDDFARDLKARMQGEPHVFETVPTLPDMRETIRSHLELIAQMRAWEAEHGRNLRTAGRAGQE
jgi:hypothetical protein